MVGHINAALAMLLTLKNGEMKTQILRFVISKLGKLEGRRILRVK